jgi:hypothetical protein
MSSPPAVPIPLSAFLPIGASPHSVSPSSPFPEPGANDTDDAFGRVIVYHAGDGIRFDDHAGGKAYELRNIGHVLLFANGVSPAEQRRLSSIFQSVAHLLSAAGESKSHIATLRVSEEDGEIKSQVLASDLPVFPLGWS